MKIKQLWIDGYGRFTARKVELAPGLQVVAGPNEQGKTTLREFIGDVLFGQSRNGSIEDGPDRRVPWESGEGYGGRVQYVLDDGSTFELRRDFERGAALLLPLNGNRGENVRLKAVRDEGDEMPTAETHLGIGKKVFLSVATITHQTLDSLGDDEALSTIRERLLALTDMGAGGNSTESALAWLKERIEGIGRPDAATRPLPRVRVRRSEVQQEFEDCVARKAEVVKLEEQRRTVRRQIETLSARHSALQAELRAHDKHERIQRLQRAEELSRRIDALTKNTFMLAGAREFPLERVQEAEHAVALSVSAEEKANTIQAELDGLQQRLARARKRLDPAGTLILEDIDPAYEMQLADCENRIARANDRIAELTESRDDVAGRLDDAEAELRELPDFGKHAADPVQWLTELSNSVESARRSLSDRETRLERMKADREEKLKARAEAHELFGSIEDFYSEVREYGVRTKEIEETLRRLEETEEAAKVHAAELQSKIPGFAFIAALGITGLVFLIVAALYLGNVGIYVPAAFAFAVLSYAGLGVLFCRRGVRRAKRDVERVRQKTAEAKLADLNARELIEGLMRDSRCQTIWELEAAYDRYRQQTLELAMLDERIAEQEQRRNEAAEHADEMFRNVRDAFGKLGESLDDAGEVAAAAKRAIGRYQAYRDAKRRAGELKGALERIDKELQPLIEERDALKQQEVDVALEVRRLLREYNYTEEEKCDSALKALQGYRLRVAQMRQNRQEVDVLKGRVAEKSEQLESERQAFARHLAELNELLEEAKVSTVEEYRERATTARKYHEEWRERATLEEQLTAILEGRDHSQLRRAIEGDAIEPKPSDRSADELRADLEACAAELDEKRQEDHALHIAIAERNVGARTLNEIEEEAGVAQRQMEALELELQAASYAASIIEEVADERHARLAPRLERLASAYLEEITSGTYRELQVGRDLRISVRIPQTKAIDEHPERRLSKGTIDQIYLALRLAMVQAVSASAERIPMLLDDPFANYDDLRLARAMTLLAHIAEDTQILLFTCRDDVVRAAREIDLPIIRL